MPALAQAQADLGQSSAATPKGLVSRADITSFWDRRLSEMASLAKSTHVASARRAKQLRRSHVEMLRARKILWRLAQAAASRLAVLPTGQQDKVEVNTKCSIKGLASPQSSTAGAANTATPVQYLEEESLAVESAKELCRTKIEALSRLVDDNSSAMPLLDASAPINPDLSVQSLAAANEGIRAALAYWQDRSKTFRILGHQLARRTAVLWVVARWTQPEPGEESKDGHGRAEDGEDEMIWFAWKETAELARRAQDMETMARSDAERYDYLARLLPADSATYDE